jgi:FAD synthetase
MKEKKKTTVLTTGAFDILHYGHIRLLEEAKKAGGKDARLIVIVASDRTIEKRKGRKPVLPGWERRTIVAALRVVDEALLGLEEMEMENAIEQIKPDVVAVGYDQDDIEMSLKQLIKEKGYNIQIVKIGRFGSEELDSSSKIKGRVIEDWRKRP